MRRLYENRFAMVETTVAFLNKNSSVWQNIPAFVKAVEDLGQVMSAIKTASAKQLVPTTGITASKAQARDELEESLLEIADQLYAFAAATKNVELTANSEVSRSSLGRLSEDELEATAKRIADLAAANLPGLADYLVTPDDVTELTNLTTGFVTVKTAPRTAVVERASSTANLPELIAEASNILRARIDKLTTKLLSTNPDFVAGYRSARVIVDRAGRGSEESTHPDKAPTEAPAQ